jgi:fumarylacetoacetate (FAA) hydrolase family protein
MKQPNLLLTLTAGIILAFAAGCSQPPKAATAQDAIQQSEAKQTPQEKVDYLVSQANAFVNGKQFEEGIAVAQHILQKLDANSQEAKSIVERATEELAKVANQKVAEVKTDITNKINALGK